MCSDWVEPRVCYTAIATITALYPPLHEFYVQSMCCLAGIVVIINE